LTTQVVTVKDQNTKILGMLEALQNNGGTGLKRRVATAYAPSQESKAVQDNAARPYRSLLIALEPQLKLAKNIPLPHVTNAELEIVKTGQEISNGPPQQAVEIAMSISQIGTEVVAGDDSTSSFKVRPSGTQGFCSFTNQHKFLPQTHTKGWYRVGNALMRRPFMMDPTPETIETLCPVHKEGDEPSKNYFTGREKYPLDLWISSLTLNETAKPTLDYSQYNQTNGDNNAELPARQSATIGEVHDLEMQDAQDIIRKVEDELVGEHDLPNVDNGGEKMVGVAVTNIEQTFAHSIQPTVESDDQMDLSINDSIQKDTPARDAIQPPPNSHSASQPINIEITMVDALINPASSGLSSHTPIEAATKAKDCGLFENNHNHDDITEEYVPQRNAAAATPTTGKRARDNEDSEASPKQPEKRMKHILELENDTTITPDAKATQETCIMLVKSNNERIKASMVPNIAMFEIPEQEFRNCVIFLHAHPHYRGDTAKVAEKLRWHLKNSLWEWQTVVWNFIADVIRKHEGNLEPLKPNFRHSILLNERKQFLKEVWEATTQMNFDLVRNGTAGPGQIMSWSAMREWTQNRELRALQSQTEHSTGMTSLVAYRHRKRVSVQASKNSENVKRLFAEEVMSQRTNVAGESPTPKRNAEAGKLSSCSYIDDGVLTCIAIEGPNNNKKGKRSVNDE
jgi:hypothetical protein